MAAFLRGSPGLPNCYRPGTTVCWPAFTTLTLTPAVALESVSTDGGPQILFKIRRSLTARVVHGYSPLGVDAQEVLLPPTRFCVRSLHRYSDSAIWHGTSAVPQLETLSAEGWAIHTTDNRVPQELAFEEAALEAQLLIVLDEVPMVQETATTF